MLETPFLQEFTLAEKTILVTGASSGIGRASAQLFSRLGARVILVARNEERLRLVQESLAGEGHAIYSIDLSQVDAIPGCMKKIAQEHGALSGVLHAAGVGGIKTINVLKGKDIEHIFSSSIKAALLLARGVSQKGVYNPNNFSLVFMSSAAAVCGVRGMSVYSASKAAIDGAMRSLACELAPKHIRVNSIIAGGILTEMHETIKNILSAEEMREYEKKHLFGFGTPDDVAHAAAFLLSDWAKWITGTTMIIDGGYSCQ